VRASIISTAADQIRAAMRSLTVPAASSTPRHPASTVADSPGREQVRAAWAERPVQHRQQLERPGGQRVLAAA
jgi:hypothetical protein